MVYRFEFGDGTSQTVQGAELSHMSVEMTMYAEVTHIYTAGTQNILWLFNLFCNTLFIEKQQQQNSCSVSAYVFQIFVFGLSLYHMQQRKKKLRLDKNKQLFRET